MAWMIEYYEQQDTTQPAEVFEDALTRRHMKLAGKLARIAVALQQHGHKLGGGLIEPCHGYNGLWEMRAISGQSLGREFFGFDGDRVVLLHGYVKRSRQEASKKDLAMAEKYWKEYSLTHKVSPVEG
jgi:phage-related protein